MEAILLYLATSLVVSDWDTADTRTPRMSRVRADSVKVICWLLHNTDWHRIRYLMSRLPRCGGWLLKPPPKTLFLNIYWFSVDFALCILVPFVSLDLTFVLCPCSPHLNKTKFKKKTNTKTKQRRKKKGEESHSGSCSMAHWATQFTL